MGGRRRERKFTFSTATWPIVESRRLFLNTQLSLTVRMFLVPSDRNQTGAFRGVTSRMKPLLSERLGSRLKNWC